MCVWLTMWASLSVAQPPHRPLPGSALLFHLTDGRTDAVCSPSVRLRCCALSLSLSLLSFCISACVSVCHPQSSPVQIRDSRWKHVAPDAPDPPRRAACSTWSAAHVASLLRLLSLPERSFLLAGKHRLRKDFLGGIFWGGWGDLFILEECLCVFIPAVLHLSVDGR